METKEAELTWIQSMKDKIQSLPVGERKTKWGDSLLAVKIRISKFFAYHRSEYRRLTELDDIDNRRQAILAGHIPAVAHFIAALQSLHASCDIMCRIGHLAVNLSGKPKLDSLTMDSLIEALDGASQCVSSHSALQSLDRCGEFKYLKAFVNVNKHRHLIQANTGINFERGEKHFIDISAFNYFGDRFDQRPATEYLDSGCQEVLTKLDAIGSSLAKEMA